MTNTVIDIYDYLQNDHHQVAELFAYFEACQDEDEQLMIIDKLNNELILHAESAESTFYKALEEHGEGIDIAFTGEQDHAEIEEKIIELKALNTPTPVWQEKVAELKRLVVRHVAEEEGRVFKVAKQLLSDEDALRLKREMNDHKNRIRRFLQFIPLKK